MLLEFNSTNQSKSLCIVLYNVAVDLIMLLDKLYITSRHVFKCGCLLTWRSRRRTQPFKAPTSRRKNSVLMW